MLEIKKNIRFKVLMPFDEIGLEKNAKILNCYGIKIYDLQESKIVDTVTGEMITKAYVFYCKGSMDQYNEFMNDQKLTEMIKYGIRTLM